MSEPTLDVLTRRLDRLERDVRWWRRTATIPLLLVVAVMLLGQSPPQPGRLEALSFVARDAEGNLRAQLGVLPSGQVGLMFLDAKGHARLHLTMNSDDSTSLLMFDGATAQRLAMRIDAETSRISLSTQDQDRALHVLTSSKTNTGLVINRGQAWRSLLTVRDDGNSQISLRDANGKERLSLLAAPAAPAALRILDQDGKIAWKAP